MGWKKIMAMGRWGCTSEEDCEIIPNTLRIHPQQPILMHRANLSLQGKPILISSFTMHNSIITYLDLLIYHTYIRNLLIVDLIISNIFLLFTSKCNHFLLLAEKLWTAVLSLSFSQGFLFSSQCRCSWSDWLGRKTGCKTASCKQLLMHSLFSHRLSLPLQQY